MRFLYKRPKVAQVREELDLLMEVMVSDQLIIVDIFWLSLLFTFLLSSAFHSVAMSILFCASCFLLFNSFYFFILKRLFK